MRHRDLYLTIVLLFISISGLAAQTQTASIKTLADMDKSFETYMKRWGIKGGTLAITRNDSLVYAKAYGISEEDVPITEETLFRVASVSKLITASGIMLLYEQGKLDLHDRIFTPEGILGDQPYTAEIRDSRYFRITIEHLLKHSAGLTSRVSGDPMFSTRSIIINNGLETVPDHKTLLGIALKQRLQYSPGYGTEYSNLGYLILSMIIEKVTGEDYESWIQRNILMPAGCKDMHIGYNFYEEKFPNETRYHTHSDEQLIQCYDNSGRMVERCYGGNDIRALSGAGAWIASATDLARFVCSINNKPEYPDILEESTIEMMTLPTDAVTYGIGWNDIKESGEWTRTGTLSGTSALIKCYPDGETWIFVTNTSTWKGARFTTDTAEQFRKSRVEYSTLLPEVNLFEE